MALSRNVAAALRIGAAQGSWVAAREALAPLEPVTRAWAQRRLQRLWRQARLLTTVNEPSHELRLAALLALEKQPSDVDDPVAVAAELE
ncbi:MAG TPA: hypothetical protein VM686_04100, partial [Polyangiaceae bacterium]|nr:hypothetical protein [Polyangiaceae bacterium]